jgi:phosphoribosylformylglycinamidine synthase
VGDPFEEKRLIEACLSLLDAGLVVGIQDLGGAGLTCATSETASRGGVGMDVYVDRIPAREAGMEAFEVLTSESQERMLAIVAPEDLDEVLAICRRWEVRASVIGTVTGDGGRLRILDHLDGEVLADVPAASLHEDAPLYDRPLADAPEAPPLPPPRWSRRWTAAPTSSGPRSTRRGCGSSTTTSSSSTPSPDQVPRPRC